LIRYKGPTDAFSQGYRNDNSDVNADAEANNPSTGFLPDTPEKSLLEETPSLDQTVLEATPSLEQTMFEPSAPSARNAAIARDASVRDILDDISKLRKPDSEGPMSYLVQRVKFSTDDEKKSKKDAKAPLYQPRNKNFIPHRTNSKGYLVMDDPVDIENSEGLANIFAIQLAQELCNEKYCLMDIDFKYFFQEGSPKRKVYPYTQGLPYKTEGTSGSGITFSKTPLSKSQKIKRRKKSQKDTERILITFSDSGGLVGARKYILDSGASFHLVDDDTLTPKEKATIETCKSITLETANGEVVVNRRCQIYVKELDIEVWAFLHKDTVCVLSLGLIVDRSGFTFVWKPGRAPTLTKGELTITSQPNHNVPFIYASKYLEARKAFRSNKFQAAPSTKKRKAGGNSSPDLKNIVEEEMKGLEDLIPDLSDAAPALAESSADEAPVNPDIEEEDTSDDECFDHLLDTGTPPPPKPLEATPRASSQKGRSRP
jgi:hypothetical protein